MSVQQKFDYYLQNTYSIRDVLERSALAGIAQWRDNPREWEQGLSGYGRRWGSNFGQYSIKKSLQFGIGAALKEDPRYFASTDRGFWKRMTHAVTHTVMVQNDESQRVFSFGRVGGTLGGSFVSRTWQPEREQTVGHALRNAGLSLGTEAGWNILREFWPDIKKIFRKGKSRHLDRALKTVSRQSDDAQASDKTYHVPYGKRRCSRRLREASEFVPIHMP